MQHSIFLFPAGCAPDTLPAQLAALVLQLISQGIQQISYDAHLIFCWHWPAKKRPVVQRHPGGMRHQGQR